MAGGNEELIIIFFLWFEGENDSCAGRCSDFWHRTYASPSPALSILSRIAEMSGVALTAEHPNGFRAVGKGWVAVAPNAVGAEVS